MVSVQPVSNTPPEALAISKVPADCNAVDGYDWNVRTAKAVCMAESRGNPEATGYNTNGTIDRGLMQVNSIHADLVAGDLTKLYDPATNVKIAYALYESRGNFTAWSTYNSGKYREFL